MEVRAFIAVILVAEVGSARSAEHARTAGGGPRHRGGEQRLQGLLGERLEIVEDHERGRLRERGGDGIGINESLPEDAADFPDRDAHRIERLHLRVIHEDRRAEEPRAHQPTPGLLRERRLSLPAKAAHRDAPGVPRQPALDLPKLPPPPEETGLGTRGQVGAQRCRCGSCGGRQRLEQTPSEIPRGPSTARRPAFGPRGACSG